jgi:hypothetical protein
MPVTPTTAISGGGDFDDLHDRRGRSVNDVGASRAPVMLIVDGAAPVQHECGSHDHQQERKPLHRAFSRSHVVVFLLQKAADDRVVT